MFRGQNKVEGKGENENDKNIFLPQILSHPTVSICFPWQTPKRELMQFYVWLSDWIELNCLCIELNCLCITLKVGKAAVLLDHGGLSRQPSILSAHASTHVGVVWQLRPHRPSVRNKVELIKQSWLIPRRQRAARKRHFSTFYNILPEVNLCAVECWATCPAEWASATPQCFSPTGWSALERSG